MNSTAIRLLAKYGIALIATGALTWFPPTGFFLTILTNALLISLICNIFLIHLTSAVYARRASIGWLALPLICYGVWFGWVVMQNRAVSAEVTKLESENRLTESLPPDLTLVFTEGDLELARRAKLHLASSVQVFVGSTELSTIRAGEVLCMLPRPDDPPFIKKSRCSTGSHVLQLPADAIFFRSQQRPDRRLGSYIYRYELAQHSESGDRAIGNFNFGWLTAPAWAPVFQAGCILIDQPSEWRCQISPKYRRVAVGETGFREQYDSFYEYSDPIVATLANMLGVKFVVEERPKPKLPETPQTTLPPPSSSSDRNDMSRYKD